MKKIAKLSLVAAVAVAGFTTAQADDHGLNIKAGVKAQYFNEQKENSANDSTIGVAGGYINVTTKAYKGLSAGAEVQFGTVLDKDDVAGNTTGAEDAEGVVLSEAYLQYVAGNTGIKIGRQHISTPLVKNSGSRVIKDSFEAITLVNKDIKNTTLVAGYISKFQNRTDGAGDVGDFEDVLDDGAYTVMAKTQITPELDATVQYASIKKDAGDTNVLFAEAGYKMGAAKVNAEVVSSDNAGAEGTLYGVKVATKVGAVALTAAATSTGDTDVVRGLGNGAFPSYTKLTVGAGGLSYKANTDSYMVKASTTVGGVKVGAGYASYNADATDNTEAEITAAYKLSANASLVASHTVFGADSAAKSESRLTLAYKF